MKSLFIAAATTAITDAQTNSLSLIEIIEALEVPQLPVLVPRLAVVWLSLKEDSDPDVTELSVELINDGKKSAYPVKVDYKGGLRHRSIIQFQGIALHTPGALEIKIVRTIGSRNRTIESLSIPIILQGVNTSQAVVHQNDLRLSTSTSKKSSRSKSKSKT